VQILFAMKRERELIDDITITPSIARQAELLRQKLIINVHGDFSVSAIHAQNVTIKSVGRSKPKLAFPTDVVGGRTPSNVAFYAGLRV